MPRAKKNAKNRDDRARSAALRQGGHAPQRRPQRPESHKVPLALSSLGPQSKKRTPHRASPAAGRRPSSTAPQGAVPAPRRAVQGAEACQMRHNGVCVPFLSSTPWQRPGVPGGGVPPVVAPCGECRVAKKSLTFCRSPALHKVTIFRNDAFRGAGLQGLEPGWKSTTLWRLFQWHTSA